MTESEASARLLFHEPKTAWMAPRNWSHGSSGTSGPTMSRYIALNRA